MKRESQIEAYLKKAKNTLGLIEADYKGSGSSSESVENLKIDVTLALVCLRIALDYLGKDIIDHYGIKLSEYQLTHHYFPLKKHAKGYQKCLRESYPGLLLHNQALCTYLESIQPYNFTWAQEFSLLVNKNKHNSLSDQTMIAHRTVLKSGQHTLILNNDSQFIVYEGATVKIGGKVFTGNARIGYDPAASLNEDKLGFDSIEREEVGEYYFVDIPRPVLEFVRESVENVEKIKDNVYSHLGN